MRGTRLAWRNVAWAAFVIGVSLTVWGISMGFSRNVPGAGHVRNVEAVVRVVVGVGLVVFAVVVATVVAPYLSRLQRRLWAAAVWATAFFGALWPTAFLADSPMSATGDPSVAIGAFFELALKVSVAAGLLASVITVLWSHAAGKRVLDPSVGI